MRASDWPRQDERRAVPGPRAGRRSRALRSGVLALVAVAVLGPAQRGGADSVVLLGDSWGVLGGPSIASVLADRGPAGLGFTNVSVGGSTAAQWNAGGVLDIGALFAAHPDAVAAHVILGGNDLIQGAVAGGDPLAVLGQTVDETVGVLAQIALATPADILLSGYEYLPSPPAGFSSAEANLLLDFYLALIVQEVIADPLLAGRVRVENTHGLMQVVFGVPQLGVAPGDPGLPDSTLPGPDVAFRDSIHLTAEAYDVYADALWDDFYATALPEPGTSTLLAIGFALWSAGRSRGRRPISGD